jgi:hypothetical protein
MKNIVVTGLGGIAYAVVVGIASSIDYVLDLITANALNIALAFSAAALLTSLLILVRSIIWEVGPRIRRAWLLRDRKRHV